MRVALPNGLTVILMESHAAPVVAMQAWIGVGSADEADGQHGIAHVFEHMLFKGTARRGVGEIAREIEMAGGDINAWTSFDNTVFHLVVASRFLETGLDVLSDAVQASSFDPQELARELEVVVEEVKQGEDSPSRQVGQGLFRTAYTQHPYRRPVIGTVESVRGLTRDVLVDFHKTWYVPENITLVVVGDFDATKVQQLVEKYWGGMPRGGTLPRVSRDEPAQSKARAVVQARDVRETHVTMAFHIPGLAHEDAAALDALSLILGQGESSRLNRVVLREKQLANDAYSYTYTPGDRGLFAVGATLGASDVDATVSALLQQVYELRHVNVSEAELAKARTIIESDRIYQKETVQGMARKLGYYDRVAGSLAYEEEYLARVRALTPDALREAAARYLVPGSLNFSVLVPKNAKRGPAQTKAKLIELARTEDVATRKRFTAPIQLAKKDGVVRVTLPNGIRVIVQRDDTVPIVAVRAVWPGGLRAETARNNGVSNLIARLLTRGTATWDAETLAHEVEGMGGALGGFAGRNSIGVRLEVLSRHWERGLELMADSILFPEFPAEELEKERRVVIEEIRAQEDNVSGVAFRLFSRTLYGKHPYGMTIHGTEASVGGITRDMMRRHYAKAYPASALTLVVVGDVDPARVVDKLRGLFGDVPGGKGKAAPEIPAAPRAGDGAVREAYVFLDRQQAHLVVGFPGLTFHDQDRFASEVLVTVLAGQGGRLFTELREKRSLAYSVSAFGVEGVDPGYLAVYVSCTPEKLGEAMEAIRAELEKIVKEPVPAAEIDRARRYLVGVHAIGLQRRGSVASSMAFGEVYGLGWDEYRKYEVGIMAVDAAAVKRVAGELIDWNRVVIATVKPPELTPGAKERAKGVKKKVAPPRRGGQAKKARR